MNVIEVPHSGSCLASVAVVGVCDRPGWVLTSLQKGDAIDYMPVHRVFF